MNTTKKLEFHPAAGMFDLMVQYERGLLLNVEENKEWRRFVDSLRINGQQVPITLYKGKILDGRNRYLALRSLSQPVEYVEYEGDNPKLQSVILNLHRRHLTTGQIAMLLAEFVLPEERKKAKKRQAATRKRGTESPSPDKSGNGEGEAADAAGKRGGISGDTVRQAAKLAESNHPEDVRNVGLIRAGKASVGGASAAQKRRERDAKEEKDKVARATRLGTMLANTLGRAAVAAGEVTQAGRAVDYLPPHIAEEIVAAYAGLRSEILNLPIKGLK